MHDAGVRRYGFHGLSYEDIASVLPQVDPKAASGKTIVLHLGNRASMRDRGWPQHRDDDGVHCSRRSADGTRPGSLDPGVLLYLMENCHFDARAVENLLYNESGLVGVSGFSSDMRTLLASSDPQAKLAIDLFC